MKMEPLALQEQLDQLAEIWFPPQVEVSPKERADAELHFMCGAAAALSDPFDMPRLKQLRSEARRWFDRQKISPHPTTGNRPPVVDGDPGLDDEEAPTVVL